MPLFDHLTVRPPEPPRGASAARFRLRESVRAELERLLNSRVSVPAHRLRERGRTVIDYGIPDFSYLSPRSRPARDWLETEITDALEAFEPRLRNVRVDFEPSSDDPKAMTVRIHALLVGEAGTEPLSFPVLLRPEPGKSEVHAAS
jgi:type VI secretion system lysozyme-like protein